MFVTVSSNLDYLHNITASIQTSLDKIATLKKKVISQRRLAFWFISVTYFIMGIQKAGKKMMLTIMEQFH